MSELNPKALEAAARALALQARVSEMEARGFNGIHASEYADEWWRSHLDRARHCLTAYLQALSAEGYGVVPREATEGMLTSGTEAWLCEAAMEERAAICWNAMFDAAQERKP